MQLNNVLAFDAALLSGELVDVSTIARDVGINWPMGVHKDIQSSFENTKQSDARLWDLLFDVMLQSREFSRKNPDASELTVKTVYATPKSFKIQDLQLVVGIDEVSENPCIVLLKENPPALE